MEITDRSLDYDLVEKASIYASHRISEYWVFEVEAQVVHVHRQVDGSRYRSIQVFGKADVIAPECRPSAKLELNKLFAEE